ncbi:IMPACT family protein [Bordetella genomosp. 13]|uniref:IMPACT family protein n=1 Tax=Bordetella genomosp. 13 TaxID=463040 RepID=UPI00119CA873|nr:YigZ family protein [Bordetella genomosp. 13]
MHTLAALCTHEEDIKKSRFLAYAGPVSTVGEAMALYARHGDPTATHNCWAYRIGNEYRSNDDGEPGGTAGRPILQAIDGQGLDRVAVLVVRWFGGIKLGAGGLARAYGGCASNCLRLGARVELIETVAARCRCDFAELPLVRAKLAQAGVGIVAESFDERGAELTLQVPRAAVAETEQVVANVTRGRGAWRIAQ